MAHFAKLDDDNKVLDVYVLNNEVIATDEGESELKGVEFLRSITGHANWKQTSYNSKFRKNFGSIGFTYNSSLDAFVPEQPFLSWILDQEICQWKPPVPYPSDGFRYVWDELIFNWIKLE